MKKILSIVVCVLLGVNVVFADDPVEKGTITIVATAQPYSGVQAGEVQVAVATAKSASTPKLGSTTWSWNEYEEDTRGVTSTCMGKAMYHTHTYKNIIGSTKTKTAKTGVQVRLTAYPKAGYYFVNWDGSFLSNDGKKENPASDETDYSESNQTYNYTANFLPIQVTGVSSSVTTLETNDLAGNASTDIVFSTPYANSVTDFTVESTLGGDADAAKGFFINPPVISIDKDNFANNKIIVRVRYTDQNIHGTEIANVTVRLVSKGNLTTNPYQEINLKATSNLTPDFTAIDCDFGTIYTKDKRSSLENLFIIPNNEVAKQKMPSLETPFGTTWTATIEGDISAFQFLDDVTSPEYGRYVIVFNPQSARNYEATLTITATYTDAKNTTPAPNKSVSVTLRGVAADPTKTQIVFDPSPAQFGDIITGQEEEILVNVSQQNVSNIVYTFDEPNDPDVFRIETMDGYVKVIAKSDNLGEYTATLNAVGKDADNNDITASLDISAHAQLQPVILHGSSNLGSTHYLVWDKIPHATEYEIQEWNGASSSWVEVNGFSKISDNSAPFLEYSRSEISEAKTYRVIASCPGYNSTSNEVTIESNKFTIAGVDHLNILTGTEGSETRFPYKPKWKVDLSSTFDAEGNALFDRVYVFGKTTGAGGATLTDNSSNCQTMSNAVTPCYVFQRLDEKGYTLVELIPNMNIDEKNAHFNIDLRSTGDLSVYATGWCPYGTTGCTDQEHGLFYFVGGEDSRVDIYLENCYLYSRVHKKNDGVTTISETSMPNYQTNAWAYGSTGAPGAASAFVFDSYSTNGDRPFRPFIHIKENNLVHAHRGCAAYFKIDLLIVKKEAWMGQYCAPIYMRPPVNNACTELTMDDVWPVDNDGNRTQTHTNGFLKFEKNWPAGPSIDLGNAYGVLNFNGGRYELAPSLNTQVNFTNNLTICHRTGRADATIEANMEAGTAEDGTGGIVNFNDGSVYVTPYPVVQIQWNGQIADNTAFYDEDELFEEDGVKMTNTIRCPSYTYIRGGSHKGIIRAVSNIHSSGTSPSDGFSTLEQRVYDVAASDLNDRFVKDEFFTDKDAGLFEKERVSCSTSHVEDMLLSEYYRRYANYYDAVGGSYGRQAIAPESDGKIYIWVPGEARRPISFTTWQVFMPYVAGSVAGSAIKVNLGGSGSVKAKMYPGGVTPEHIVKNILHCNLDGDFLDKMNEAYSGDIKIPVKLPTGEYYYTTIDNSLSEGYANVTNTESYDIQTSIYHVINALADEWITFCPPFDISEIYVLESCNEAVLREVAEEEGRDAALEAQALCNVDFASIVAMQLTSGSSAGTFMRAIDYNYKQYVSYVQQNKTANDVKDRAKYYLDVNGNPVSVNNIITRTPLVHLSKTVIDDKVDYNYESAHYYLYKTPSKEWTLNKDGNTLSTDWILAPSKEENGGILMNKGEIYAMQFPYCPGCNDEEEWDYWTGKFIVFEGVGPQTIAGSNGQPTFTPTAETFVLQGNATFKDMDIAAASQVHIAAEGKFYNPVTDVKLSAGGVGLVPPTSFDGGPIKRIKSINAETGAITWEEGGDNQNTTTGTPTISGDRQMMVYTIEGGVGIIPVTAQQVSIYNAAGQLITSQYLTDEVQISLPTGIYLVSGEKDQAKVIVK